MAASLEDILISVWQQTLVEEAKTVTVAGRSFRVRRTRLREVDVRFGQHKLRVQQKATAPGSPWSAV